MPDRLIGLAEKLLNIVVLILIIADKLNQKPAKRNDCKPKRKGGR